LTVQTPKCRQHKTKIARSRLRNVLEFGGKLGNVTQIYSEGWEREIPVESFIYKLQYVAIPEGS
jgi:hypothetical protein